MIGAGFIAETKEAAGFVRSYEYKHPAGHHFVVTTGAHCDHWRNKKSGKTGLWAELQPHINTLRGNHEAVSESS
jgi:hypothetical protein